MIKKKNYICYCALYKVEKNLEKIKHLKKIQRNLRLEIKKRREKISKWKKDKKMN